MNLSWALLDPSSFQECTPYHGFLPSRLWPNRPKLSLLKSRAVTPVFALLLLPGSSTSPSHGHYSQNFSLIFTSPTSSSLFVRSSTTCPLFYSSTTCLEVTINAFQNPSEFFVLSCAVPPADTDVVEAPPWRHGPVNVRFPKKAFSFWSSGP